MSELVRSTRCRRWMTLATIFAMVVFAGPAFAASRTIAKHARPIAVADDDPSNPSGDNQTQSGSTTIPAAPSNDTCASPTPLALNRTVRVDTSGANDDYQSPANAACFAGIGQTLTT